MRCLRLSLNCDTAPTRCTTRLAGTGLGLATVREIVRDHEGAINVASIVGQGSRFEAWLPATKTGARTMAGPAMLPLGHGETVLVVESDREPFMLTRSEKKHHLRFG